MESNSETGAGATGPRTDRALLKKYLSKVPYLLFFGLLLDLAIVHFVSGREGVRALGSISVPFLFLAVSLTFVPWATRSLRIMVWTRFFGKGLSPVRALRVVLGTEIAAAVTPTAVGGAPAKAAILYREGFSPATAIVMTTLGTFEDGLFFVMAVPMAILLSPTVSLSGLLGYVGGADWSTWLAVVAALAAVCLGLVALLRWEPRGHGWPKRILRRLRGWLANTWIQIVEASHSVARGGRRNFVYTVPLSGIQWSARYLIVSLVAWGLGIDVDPALLFMLQCVVFTMMTAVPLPGASGGAEGSFLLIHRDLIPSELAGVVATGWRFVTFHLPVAVAGVLLLVITRKLSAENGGGDEPLAPAVR